MLSKSIFSIASNSKLFTAVSAGLLVHDESLSPRVEWTSKIKDLVPGWKLMDPVASEETDLRDLLSKSSFVSLLGVGRADEEGFGQAIGQAYLDMISLRRILRPSRDW